MMNGKHMNKSNRTGTGWRLVLAGIVILTMLTAGCVKAVTEKVILKKLRRADTAILQDPGIHVIMAGNGSPAFDNLRNPQCTAVIAGGKFLLFDAGDGCMRTLDFLNLPVNQISAVFLTHYHSDHINGLGHLISHTWVNWRKTPIHVYGPPGVEKVVNGFAESAREDILLRSDPKSLFPHDAALAVGVPHPFTYPEDGTPVVVWKESGLVVKAFKNNHVDVKISAGYRIEYGGRVVVISGDTVKCPYVVRNAAGADILIHEATNKQLVENVARIAEQNLGKEGAVTAARFRAVIQHHSSPVDVAEIARDAGVASLVITHVIPGIPDNFILKGLFLEGVSDIYKGPVMVAKDGDRLYLPPVK